MFEKNKLTTHDHFGMMILSKPNQVVREELHESVVRMYDGLNLTSHKGPWMKVQHIPAQSNLLLPSYTDIAACSTIDLAMTSTPMWKHLFKCCC